MATFVYFTRLDGTEVYCNLDHISRFAAGGQKHTYIRFDDGSMEDITETPAEIATRLDEVQ